MNRQAIIDTYRQNPEISVLIVGGGINGIGTFRDLALQGVDVLLVEKGDFCSGASAAASRMAHGGIRYLENGEFRLVRESLAERNRLLQNAPHAVAPILFTVPVFNWFSGVLNAPLKFLRLRERPSERGAIVIKLGMMLYDWFTRRNRMTPTHRILGRNEALKKHARLNPRIIGAATYYDALMPRAERIGLELVLDAEAQSEHARALNYVRVAGSAGDTVQLQDDVSGTVFEVRPRIVVNAAGAWIDIVNRALQHESRLIGGTKGSHIVVENAELHKTLNGSAIFFENRDGRLCIFYPLFDKVIIGATDIRIDDPDQAICSDEEIDYFLQFPSYLLPGIHVDRSQIIYHFSGVRPLPGSKDKFTGHITRDHSIEVIEPDAAVHFPIYSLVGGKWTTYRAFSEQTTDKVLAFLGRSRSASTRDLPIGGGKEYPRTSEARDAWLTQAQATTGLPRPRLEALFERYGTRAEAVATFIAAGPDELMPNGYSNREIMFIAEFEKTAHLDDVILRRSLMGFLGLVDDEVLMRLGSAVGAALGWTAEQTHQEIERAADLLITRHGVPAARLRLSAAMGST